MRPAPSRASELSFAVNAVAAAQCGHEGPPTENVVTPRSAVSKRAFIHGVRAVASSAKDALSSAKAAVASSSTAFASSTAACAACSRAASLWQ
jgi:hypothetical protein